MSDIDPQLINKEQLTYDEMQELASHHDAHIRCTLAQRQDLRPEVLYFLAQDSDINVRTYIALNPNTPRQADLLLARDHNESVRCKLSEKIAKFAPDANAQKRNKIQDLTYEALRVLSRDQVTSVRQILSEALKNRVDAPGDIIKHLALDMEVVVAGPILEFSPVLSDSDLLEIIATSQAKGALNAISKRQTVSESVSEAVVASNEESAIADLLSNQNAQIRENTLDLLADRAQDVLTWHGPLSRRPKLSEVSVKRMAHYLADNLLKALQEREDLPDTIISTLQEEVKKRIDHSDNNLENEQEADPIDEVLLLKEEGTLDEAVLSKWIDSSDWLYVYSVLAVMSDLRRVTVKKIMASQSAKGVMALTWKAGLSAEMGETLQFKVAKILINDIMHANSKGDFPLSDDELSWHLELFGDA